MRSIILTCAAALACLASPTAAQHYRAQQPYAPPSAYERFEDYERGDWDSYCRDYLIEQDRRGDRGAVIGGLVGGVGGALIGNEVAGEGSRLAGALIGGGVGTLAGAATGRSIARGGDDAYERACEGWYDSRYDSEDYPYRDYRPDGYYEPAPRYPYRDGYSDRGGYARYGGSGYAYSHGGGYALARSGGVLVILEDQHAERYVPVIREEIVEEYYEVEEREVIRERVIEHVPQPRPQPRPGKRIKYIKQR